MSGLGERIPRLVFAACFSAAALSHAIAALGAEPGAARHAIFVGINGVMAVLVIAAPRLALVAAIPLGIQQLFSHGTALVDGLRTSRIDWASIGVLLFFPVLIAWLAAAARRRRVTR